MDDKEQVCQAFSQSRTSDNRPFSIHVELRRGDSGHWNTNMIIVIGRQGYFLTNPGVGGGAGYVCLICNNQHGNMDSSVQMLIRYCKSYQISTGG